MKNNNLFGWVKSSAGARYAGTSERTFRKWLKSGLRYARLPSGTILIKYKWIDDFLESFEVEDVDKQQINKVVYEVMDGMNVE